MQLAADRQAAEAKLREVGACFLVREFVQGMAACGTWCGTPPGEAKGRSPVLHLLAGSLLGCPLPLKQNARLQGWRPLLPAPCAPSLNSAFSPSSLPTIVLLLHQVKARYSNVPAEVEAAATELAATRDLPAAIAAEFKAEAPPAAPAKPAVPEAVPSAQQLARLAEAARAAGRAVFTLPESSQPGQGVPVGTTCTIYYDRSKGPLPGNANVALKVGAGNFGWGSSCCLLHFWFGCVCMDCSKGLALKVGAGGAGGVSLCLLPCLWCGPRVHRLQRHACSRVLSWLPRSVHPLGLCRAGL